MRRKSPYARVSITLPREVLAAGDRLARAADRPRSWVIAEAIRIYQGGPQAQPAAPALLHLTPEELLARPITVIGDAPAVDVFTVAWTVKYEQAVGRAASARVEGVVIPFVGLDDLIATKRTGGLQEAADIEVLEEIKRALAESGRG